MVKSALTTEKIQFSGEKRKYPDISISFPGEKKYFYQFPRFFRCATTWFDT